MRTWRVMEEEMTRSRSLQKTKQEKQPTFQELLDIPTLLLKPNNKLRIVLKTHVYEIDLKDESISVYQ